MRRPVRLSEDKELKELWERIAGEGMALEERPLRRYDDDVRCKRPLTGADPPLPPALEPLALPNVVGGGIW